MKQGLVILTVSSLFVGILGCSTPLTTREKGTGIGALGGAAVGGIIGSAGRHPVSVALIGTALGAGTGALIGDQLQGHEQVQQNQQQQIEQNRAEIEHQRDELDRLRQQKEY